MALLPAISQFSTKTKESDFFFPLFSFLPIPFAGICENPFSYKKNYLFIHVISKFPADINTPLYSPAHFLHITSYNNMKIYSYTLYFVRLVLKMFRSVIRHALL